MDYPADTGVFADSLILSGPITYVPEFHDCQRFIVRKQFLWWNWRKYESLNAIWVRNRLDTVTFSLRLGNQDFIIPAGADSASITAPGQVTHWSGNVPQQSERRPPGPAGVPVALVWSDQGYGPLGVRAGFNCLYLYNPIAWKAKMVPVQDQASCRDNVDPDAVTGTVLPVVKNTVPGRINQDYPPVARWDQGVGRDYSVGIKCMAAWCEIGPGVASGPTQAYTGGRTRQIKGWYDEQHLAVHTLSNEQKPTWILGVVFPAEGLDALVQNGFTENAWAPVAQAVLPAGTGAKVPQGDELELYRDKFNFEASSGPSQANEIFFCYGSDQGCFGTTATSAPNCSDGAAVAAVASDKRYWAMIISAVSRDTAYRCVTYTDHGIDLPGVVRWRWLKNDEKNWISCPSGCCQINPP